MKLVQVNDPNLKTNPNHKPASVFFSLSTKTKQNKNNEHIPLSWSSYKFLSAWVWGYPQNFISNKKNEIKDWIAH